MAAALGVTQTGAFQIRYDILVTRFHDGTFDPWGSIASRTGVWPWQLDKPWIAAGEVVGGQQEYYVVYMDNGGSGSADGYAYRRSVDGGHQWQGGEVHVGGNRVGGQFCAQPAVAGNGPLYIAYVHEQDDEEGAKLRFLEGQDINVGPYAGQVTFTQPSGIVQVDCFGPGGAGAGSGSLTVPLITGRVTSYVPGSFGVKSVPYLVADPTNPDRLYLVYHDMAVDEQCVRTTDVDVYLRKIIRFSSSWWGVGSRVRVNDDNTPYESDQFLPAATVDDQGRIHIIFYDDRNYNTNGDQLDSELLPRFDVYYAISTNGGQTFGNHELYAVPDETALDFTRDVAPSFGPGEYVGITHQADEVWAAFTGTYATATGFDEESVIYASRIADLPPP